MAKTEKFENFNKDTVIEFAVKNLKQKNPVGKYKDKEVEQEINERIEFLLDKTGGMTAKEIGASLANRYGEVPLHFSFDRYRPFTVDEKKKHNLMGHSDKELAKALNKIRMQERKEKKAIWDKKRREEIGLFRQYFTWYLESTRGEHKKNEMGVIIGVGDDIQYKDGHYKRLY